MKRDASEKVVNCWAQWILPAISVVHLIALGLLVLWSIAIAIDCSLPRLEKLLRLVNEIRSDQF